MKLVKFTVGYKAVVGLVGQRGSVVVHGPQLHRDVHRPPFPGRIEYLVGVSLQVPGHIVRLLPPETKDNLKEGETLAQN